jgi:hypothetical protein
MRRISNSAKRNRIKLEKSKFGKFNLENYVILDAHNVVCDTNIKKIGDIGTGSILAKNREIA